MRPLLSAMVLFSLLPTTSLAADKVAIVLYEGIGTERGAWLSGRVLEDKGLDPPAPGERTWRKAQRLARLLESDEIPRARVEVQVLGKRHDLRADDEGLFSLSLPGPLPLGRHPIQARTFGYPQQRTLPAMLAVWPARAATVVVSDIDDTVLDTGVTHKGRMVRRLLTSNALDLKTFEGCPEQYRRWYARGWPVVFVSGSPINLQPRLRRFLDRHGFPPAPLWLKNVGTSAGSDALLGQDDYKSRQLARIMSLLPGYHLVLAGDSGEHDPEIYARVRAEHPALVEATYIRQVPGARTRAQPMAHQRAFASWREVQGWEQARTTRRATGPDNPTGAHP